jgi:hypothetical protein
LQTGGSGEKKAYEAAKRAGGGKEPVLDYKDGKPHYHLGTKTKREIRSGQINRQASHDHYYFPKGK